MRAPGIVRGLGPAATAAGLIVGLSSCAPGNEVDGEAVDIRVGTLMLSEIDGVPSSEVFLAGHSMCLVNGIPVSPSDLSPILLVKYLSTTQVATYDVPSRLQVIASLPQDGDITVLHFPATSGTFTISASDAHSITGSIDVSFGSAGNVRGSFYAPVCPSADGG